MSEEPIPPKMPPMPPLPPDAFDEEQGYLSLLAPGDPTRELIHEIKNLRVAIRLAEATFVRRTEIESKFSTKTELAEAERKIAHYKHQATQRFWFAFLAVVAALSLLGVGGLVAGRAYFNQQKAYKLDQYRTCVERNAQLERSRKFFSDYIEIESESADQVTGRRLVKLIQDSALTPTVQPDCSRLKP